MDSIINIAKRKKIEDVEIYKSETESDSLKTFNTKVESYQTAKQNVICIRGTFKGKMGYIYTENTSEDPELLIDRLIQNTKLVNSGEVEEIFSGSENYTEITSKFNGYSPSFIEIKNKVDNLETMIRSSDTLITDTTVSYSKTKTIVSITNSKGLKLHRTNTRFILVADVVAKKDDYVSNEYDYTITDNFSELNTQTLSNNVVTKTINQLGAVPCKSNCYKAIISHEAMNDILGVLPSLFSAENIQKGLSPLRNKLGKKLMGSNITIIDNPHMSDGYNSCSFDDEGVATTQSTVVKNGVINNFLYNLKTANKDKTKTTGNGFKSSVAGKVQVNATNFYIKPGSSNFHELIKQVKQGILITNVSGIHAGINTYNGDFSLQSRGYLISNSKIDSPVKLITISGNIFELLSNVISVGNDLKFSYNGYGSPSLLISKLIVSGK